jgi:hypothetical protein
VEVVRDQAPGEDPGPCRGHECSEPRQQILAILVIAEDLALLDSSGHHVVKCADGI